MTWQVLDQHSKIAFLAKFMHEACWLERFTAAVHFGMPFFAFVLIFLCKHDIKRLAASDTCQDKRLKRLAASDTCQDKRLTAILQLAIHVRTSGEPLFYRCAWCSVHERSFFRAMSQHKTT